MIKFSTKELEYLIDSDGGYGDLTTELMDLDAKARLSLKTREEICVSCIDTIFDLARIYNCICNCKFKNGDIMQKNDEIITLEGDFNTLHIIYKSIQNLLEYSCGIASYTNSMVKAVKSVNEYCEVLVTRKVFSFAKKLCLKTASEGGAKIHRLGISDSVLFFEKHINAYLDSNNFLMQIPKFKKAYCEKKIIVESGNLDFAKALLITNVDGLQCDKMSIEDINDLVKFKKAHFNNAIILVAGGISLQNSREYATTGIEAIVTSAIYRGYSNIGAKIELI